LNWWSKNTSDGSPTRTPYYWLLRVCELFGWTLDYMDEIEFHQKIALITYVQIREIEEIEKQVPRLL